MLGSLYLYSPPAQGQKELTLFESKLGPIDHSERVSPSIEGSVSRLDGLENELIPTPNVALSSQ